MEDSSNQTDSTTETKDTWDDLSATANENYLASDQKSKSQEEAIISFEKEISVTLEDALLSKLSPDIRAGMEEVFQKLYRDKEHNIPKEQLQLIIQNVNEKISNAILSNVKLNTASIFETLLSLEKEYKDTILEHLLNLESTQLAKILKTFIELEEKLKEALLTALSNLEIKQFERMFLALVLLENELQQKILVSIIDLETEQFEKVLEAIVEFDLKLRIDIFSNIAHINIPQREKTLKIIAESDLKLQQKVFETIINLDTKELDNIYGLFMSFEPVVLKRLYITFISNIYKHFINQDKINEEFLNTRFTKLLQLIHEHTGTTSTNVHSTSSTNYEDIRQNLRESS